MTNIHLDKNINSGKAGDADFSLELALNGGEEMSLKIAYEKFAKVRSRIRNYFKHEKKLGTGKKDTAWEKLVHRSMNATSTQLSIKQQALFAKRLAFLIRAGVPILESLQMLRDQSNSKRYSKILDVVIRDVSNGQYLSKSLGKFEKTFGKFVINIIKIGESSGTLSQNLEYLAEELKNRQNLRRKVIGALVYPLVVTIATFGITGMLVGYIFPKIMPIFASMHVELPLSTRIVLAISNFIGSYWILLIIATALFFVGFSVLFKWSERSRYYFDLIILRTPLFGPMIRAYNLSNITRTLGLLLKSGILLSNSLEICSDTTKNVPYRYALDEIGRSINRGKRLHSHMQKSRMLFPDLMYQLIAIGERSGSLSDTLVYLSEMYEGEVDDFTKNLSSLLEPVLMIIMGIMVGFIAISVISPIYAITQQLHA